MRVYRNEYFRVLYLLFCFIMLFSVWSSNLLSRNYILIGSTYVIALTICAVLPKQIFFSWPFWIINVTGFIRFLLIPYVDVNQSSYVFINFIEIIAVYSTFILYSIRLSGKEVNDINDFVYIKENESNVDNVLGVASVFIIIIGGIIIGSNRQVLQQYFRLSTSKNIVTFSNGFFALVVSALFLIALIVAMNWIDKLTFFPEFIKILLMICISIFYINGASITGDNVSRWGLLISSMVVYYFIISFYPGKKKMLLLILGVGLGVIITYGTLYKFNLVSVNKYSSLNESMKDMFSIDTLNSYFAGPYSMKYGMETHRKFLSISSVLTTFISDTFANFPLLNKYLSNSEMTSMTIYNYQIYHSSIAMDKIMPLAIQYYNYLGIFFFIPEMMTVYFALKCNMLLRKNRNMLQTFCLVTGMIVLSLINCINYTIICQYFWIQILPIYIIYKVNRWVVMRKQVR